MDGLLDFAVACQSGIDILRLGTEFINRHHLKDMTRLVLNRGPSIISVSFEMFLLCLSPLNSGSNFT